MPTYKATMLDKLPLGELLQQIAQSKAGESQSLRAAIARGHGVKPAVTVPPLYARSEWWHRLESGELFGMFVEAPAVSGQSAGLYFSNPLQSGGDVVMRMVASNRAIYQQFRAEADLVSDFDQYDDFDGTPLRPYVPTVGAIVPRGYGGNAAFADWNSNGFFRHWSLGVERDNSGGGLWLLNPGWIWTAWNGDANQSIEFNLEYAFIPREPGSAIRGEPA